MKEDGARRRAFELLLQELFGGTPQLRYRHQHGSELADDVWRRFGKKCFNCGKELTTPKKMHLDHTRPLKLLWPLDATATALCGACNSEKRDRAPPDYYTDKQLVALSEITGLSLEKLRSYQPNDDAIERLLKRIDWLVDVFLFRPEMIKERDGKIAGELVIRALQKAISLSDRFRRVDLRELIAAYQKKAVIKK
jgi:hypothetical protein